MTISEIRQKMLADCLSTKKHCFHPGVPTFTTVKWLKARLPLGTYKIFVTDGEIYPSEPKPRQVIELVVDQLTPHNTEYYRKIFGF